MAEYDQVQDFTIVATANEWSLVGEGEAVTVFFGFQIQI